MLELFRKEQPVNYILLFLYCLLLRLAPFFSETNWSPLAKGALSDIVYGLTGYTTIAAHITATLLIFIQAIMINRMVNEHRLTRENSFFPGLFYILIVTLFPDFNYLSPALLANTFLIMATASVFNSYRTSGSTGEVFNAGIFVGIAMMFNFSYIIFLATCMIGFMIVRTFRLVEFIQYIIGFLVAVFLVGTYYFWVDRLPEFIAQFQTNIRWMDWVANVDTLFFVKIIIIGLLMLFAILNYGNYSKRNNVHVMRKIDVLMWMLFIPLTTFFFQAGIRLDHFLIIAVPLSILFGFSMLMISNRQMAEVLHLILIAIAFLFQYIFL